MCSIVRQDCEENLATTASRYTEKSSGHKHLCFRESLERRTETARHIYHEEALVLAQE